MATQKRQFRIVLAWAAILGLAVVLGFAIGGLVRLNAAPWPALGIGATGMIALTVLARATAWSRMDEMAREAHTTAWYWGGTLGLGLAVIGLTVLVGPRSALFLGAAIAGLFALAGYGVCRVGWWVMRRARSA